MFIPEIGPMLKCIGVQPATSTVAGYGPQGKSHYAIQRLNNTRIKDN